MKYILNLTILICIVFAVWGCAHYPQNDPSTRIDSSYGYRLNNRLLGPNNSDDIFFILGLSGGGARAMSLDYAVIRYLDSVKFGTDERSLLDEVDIISTSSAASIPAAYYGLYGKQVFLNEFVGDVLYRPIQSDLIKRALNPVHWPRLASGTFSRGDLAVEYFDQVIFHNLTFADMQQERPLILINATDMGIGSQLSFVQGNFDLICSNLSTFPVARAVVASMSFTPGFTPITLKNFNDSRCGYQTPQWARAALAAGVESDPAVYEAANKLISYENIERRPYIHLLDSGISDNIGIRSPSLIFSVREIPSSQVDRIERGDIKKLIIFLVDARPNAYFDGDLSPKPPGIVSSVGIAAGSPLANYSYDTVNLLKRGVQDIRDEVALYHRQREACDSHSRKTCEELNGTEQCYTEVFQNCVEDFQVTDDVRPPELDIYVIHASFDLIDDEVRRRHFQSIPTNLQLPKEQVDLLLEVAPELINQIPDYQNLIDDLGAFIAPEPR